jgi:hypothetical protein
MTRSSDEVNGKGKNARSTGENWISLTSPQPKAVILRLRGDSLRERGMEWMGHLQFSTNKAFLFL